MRYAQSPENESRRYLTIYNTTIPEKHTHIARTSVIQDIKKRYDIKQVITKLLSLITSQANIELQNANIELLNAKGSAVAEKAAVAAAKAAVAAAKAAVSAAEGDAFLESAFKEEEEEEQFGFPENDNYFKAQ